MCFFVFTPQRSPNCKMREELEMSSMSKLSHSSKLLKLTGGQTRDAQQKMSGERLKRAAEAGSAIKTH